MRLHYILISCFVLSGVAGKLSAIQEVKQQSQVGLTRLEFHSRLRQIHVEMTEQEVERVLGYPDAKRKMTDISGAKGDGEHVWCYGTIKPMGFPTLGRIVFSANGRVREIVGSEGIPIQNLSITEDRLKELLQEIFAISDPLDYDPFREIAVANSFHELGQDDALNVLLEFERVNGIDHSASTAVFFLLHLLHEPDGTTECIPDIAIGGMEPEIARQFAPQFPIVYVSDIPFLTVYQIEKSGPPVSIARIVANFRQHSTWRSKPIEITNRTLQAVLGDIEAFVDTQEDQLPRFKLVALSATLQKQVERFHAGRESSSRQ